MTTAIMSSSAIREENFKMALAEWMERAKKIAGYLDMMEGRKFIRIVRADGSAFCFIDKSNGDVLKPATYKGPAKHARGNIFTSELGVNEYGANYLR